MRYADLAGEGAALRATYSRPRKSSAAKAALAAIGAEPKSACRPRGTGLYFKRGEDIEDLLAALGATKTVFAFINAKILREIRNHENRVANCDTGNIQKSVSATRKQLDAIAELTRLGRLDRLDDECAVPPSCGRRIPSCP